MQRDQVVVRAMLERNARTFPDNVAATFEDGTSWTYARALEEAFGAANRLRALGVGRDDRVGVMLGNGPGFLRAWWGIACLGATMAAISPSWKGGMLTHALTLTGPSLTISDRTFRDALEAACPGLRLLDAGALADTGALADGPADAPELERPIEAWDRHHIQFTSGTTGPSKGATASYRQFYLTGSWVGDGLGWTAEDTVQCDLPLFHAGSLAVAASCLARGGRLAVRGAPSMSRYWEAARECGATFGFLVSSMAGFLMSRPPSPADRDHDIRAMLAAPLPPDCAAFQERFGIEEIVTAYGSSESSAPIIRVPGIPLVAGACGQVQQGFACRLVDGNDVEVPDGQPGELVIRSDQPWSLTTGYYENPAATVELWRNGWLHTGDQLRRDPDGNFYFVDRLKDALRRRGENISSFEVERGALGFPGVQEVACVASPDELGDGDEVKLWVVAEQACQVDFLALARHMADQLPHYMVPRYFELIATLPKTPSMRVRKVELRARGNGADTWDLTASGFRTTRAGIVAA
jgi:crotonobetaine/carnitine-CoA ligase